MPPSGPGVSLKAPNREWTESAQISRHIGTKHAVLFLMFALEETGEETVKEKVRFFVVRIVFLARIVF